MSYCIPLIILEKQMHTYIYIHIHIHYTEYTYIYILLHICILYVYVYIYIQYVYVDVHVYMVYALYNTYIGISIYSCASHLFLRKSRNFPDFPAMFVPRPGKTAQAHPSRLVAPRGDVAITPRRGGRRKINPQEMMAFPMRSWGFAVKWRN